MKKLLVLLCISHALCWGQHDSLTVSNAELFSSKSGTLFEKEFVDLGKVKKVEFEILKVTDMISGASIKSLRIRQNVKNGYSSGTKIITLDSDEIDGLLKSIRVIKSEVLGNSPTNYTEIAFYSRSGFEMGCFWGSKDQWVLYLRLEKKDRTSTIFLKKEEFDEFNRLLENAQATL